MPQPSDNPFFAEWETPFGIAPFHDIRPEHFVPAFERGMAENAADIAAIVADPTAPSFDNTIKPLERAGLLLSRVNRVFWNLTGANTNPALQAIEREISPVLAKHYQAITMDQGLFARVEAVDRLRGTLDLDEEQARVLDLTIEGFVRGGAKLDANDRQKLTAIVERLAVLGTSFSQNVLADEKAYELVLEGEADLAGLPPALRDAAAQAATERGLTGGSVITLSRSLVVPFLQFSSRRDLREKAYSAWTKRGENADQHDNRAIVAETVKLRAERAALLGFPSFAHYKLDDTMAKTPDAVRDLLDRVWIKARERAEVEAKDLEDTIAAEGGNFDLAGHDWRYYSEKVRHARYDIDDAEVRAYFALDNIIAAAFDTAHRLFGLTFTERRDVPVYHPDVRAFDVTDGDGQHVALFLGDYFARSSKRSGAWNSGFRVQERMDGEVRPIVVNVMNFAKGGQDEPSLLNIDDARTLFHEFGHALHCMLSDVTYPSIAGTSVSRDFVEFPSQLYEHWIMQPTVLKRFARHAITGEPIPDHLIERIKQARNFNQGFATVEYCASAYVDLDFHLLSREAAAAVDAGQFERDSLARIGMPTAIVMRHRTPHFSHVFSGDGYSAGYYSYLWSEVLDADGFGAFEEAGDIFDPTVAKKLRDYVYAAGSRRDPAEAYRLFRGRMPDPATLLEKRGLS
ncbi:M3 family metallopeptidase [Lichenihabitans sp. PAMC28606]|uniref:M3 family metallopeptidase n=1 Tax=Lichenihabitans sp. PAMC28606 TaxID=2880932 RepID=UPI001D0B3A9D|nr:M3 family metallopeptidase [Lichenihabitans sp. PAMC28606]UDL96643.1 M3 family metallopeptidase [Lichenihabitans sp. PAMC28606]